VTLKFGVSVGAFSQLEIANMLFRILDGTGVRPAGAVAQLDAQPVEVHVLLTIGAAGRFVL